MVIVARRHASSQSGSYVCFTEITFLFIYLCILFFKTLCEKASEPIIVKPEHKIDWPSMLRTRSSAIAEKPLDAPCH